MPFLLADTFQTSLNRRTAEEQKAAHLVEIRETGREIDIPLYVP